MSCYTAKHYIITFEAFCRIEAVKIARLYTSVFVMLLLSAVTSSYDQRRAIRFNWKSCMQIKWRALQHGLLFFPPLPQTFLISSLYYSLIFISSLPELCRKSSGFLMHFLANSRLTLSFCFRGVHTVAARCSSQRSCWFIFAFTGSLRRVHVNIIDRGLFFCCCYCCSEWK